MTARLGTESTIRFSEYPGLRDVELVRGSVRAYGNRAGEVEKEDGT